MLLIKDGIDIYWASSKELIEILNDFKYHYFRPVSSYNVKTVGAINFDLTDLDPEMAEALLSYLEKSKC